jgi:hypothetical protein
MPCFKEALGLAGGEKGLTGVVLKVRARGVMGGESAYDTLLGEVGREAAVEDSRSTSELAALRLDGGARSLEDMVEEKECAEAPESDT